MTSLEKVYSIVSSIPSGKVLTYGTIANKANLNPRFVGYALHHNPDPEKIPCHRVVNFQGKLSSSFAFGGLQEQKKRLESEGVKIENSKVLLSEFLWT